MSLVFYSIYGKASEAFEWETCMIRFDLERRWKAVVRMVCGAVRQESGRLVEGFRCNSGEEYKDLYGRASGTLKKDRYSRFFSWKVEFSYVSDGHSL